MHRAVKYDLLRILACFAVVLLHVSNSYWYTVDITGNDFLIMTVYNSFTRFAVPVFFMLSGLFLLDPARKFSVKKWAKRLWKLVLGFFLWSLFYAFQSVLFNGVMHGWSSVSREMWQDAVTRLIMGHGHMWFIRDLFGFYLLLPVLRKICEDIKILGYFLLLWVSIQFVVLTLFPNIGNGMVPVVVNNMHLYMLTGFVGYFLGGYFLNQVSFPKAVRYLLYACGAGALIFTMIITITVCRESGSYNDQWLLPSTINVLIMSSAIFVLFKHIRVQKRIEDSRWVPSMAKCTFFVYMAHPFFIEKLNLLGIKVIAFPVIISIPIMTAAIFTAAMFLGWLISKIPVVGKWVMLQ